MERGSQRNCDAVTAHLCNRATGYTLRNMICPKLPARLQQIAVTKSGYAASLAWWGSRAA